MFLALPTSSGIQYLRDYLHLPQEIVPATLKRPVRTETARPRPKGKMFKINFLLPFFQEELVPLYSTCIYILMGGGYCLSDPGFVVPCLRMLIFSANE